MATTYTVSAGYHDRFAGLRMHPGYSVVLRSSSRIVEWLSDKGVPQTNEFHSPTDEDFAFMRGEYDRMLAAGTLTIAAPAKKVDAPAVDPPKDPPKTDTAKTDPPKVSPKTDDAKQPPVPDVTKKSGK